VSPYSHVKLDCLFFCGPMLAGLTLPEEPGLGEKKEKEL